MTENDESFGDKVAAPMFAALDKVGWPLWTDAMYNMLACFDSRGEQIVRRGRIRCGANPKASGCGGAGGGGAGFKK